MDFNWGKWIILAAFGAGIVAGSFITVAVVEFFNWLSAEVCPDCDAKEVWSVKFDCDCEGE